LLNGEVTSDGRPSRLALVSMGLVLVTMYCVFLSALLPTVHEALEWMVK
jgi:hypothetical protein